MVAEHYQHAAIHQCVKTERHSSHLNTHFPATCKTLQTGTSSNIKEHQGGTGTVLLDAVMFEKISTILQSLSYFSVCLLEFLYFLKSDLCTSDLFLWSTLSVVGEPLASVTWDYVLNETQLAFHCISKVHQSRRGWRGTELRSVPAAPYHRFACDF